MVALRGPALSTWASSRTAATNSVCCSVTENSWPSRRLRAKGLSLRGIAAEIGCSVGTVHRYVAEQKAEQKT
ncbi:hypothetical protein, partial [Corynebacterium tapiri]|uniref:hypothetical protein n=1 Tax=Corynebacterium tapiri TaxID=1448266 RepID=UPI003CCC68D3